MKKTNSQKLADIYSENGAHQVLVAIYENEAVLWAQCSEATAKALANPLCMAKPLIQMEDAGLSADGLTYCWWFKRSKFHGQPKVDWLAVVMTEVYAVIREHAPHLMAEEENINYRDNRVMDANTVESFLRQVNSA